uniref:Putative secreted protein n=1 Tax=Aedes albopictus TaxID=7160 RepID=A0A023EGK6_AEDAL
MNRLLVGALFGVALFRTALAIECYVCNATDSSTPFQCSEWFDRFDTPDIKPQDCSNVYGAKYCIKHIGRFEGGIGAKRYCSSRDLGNYCNYVRNPGDQIEYRSCIFTCDTDGCNGASSLFSFQRQLTLGLVLGTAVVMLARFARQ